MSVVLVAIAFVLGIIHTTESNEEITVNDLLLDSLLIQWVPSNYVPSEQLLNVKDPEKQDILISLEERQMALENYLRHLIRSIEEYREDADDQITKNSPDYFFSPSLLKPNSDTSDKLNNAPSNCVPIAYTCEYPTPNQKESTDLVPLYPGLYPAENNPTGTDDNKDEITEDMVKGVLDLLTLTLPDQSDDDDPETSSCNIDCEALNPERSSSQQSSGFLQVLVNQRRSYNGGPLDKNSPNDDYGDYINCLAERVSCLYKEINRRASRLSKSCDDSRGARDSDDDSDYQTDDTSNTDLVESRIFEKWYFPNVAQDLLQSVYSNTRAKYNDNKYIGYRKSLVAKKNRNSNQRTSAQKSRQRARYLSSRRTLYRPIRGTKDRVGKRMMGKKDKTKKNSNKPKQQQ